MKTTLYENITLALRTGKLKEPFTPQDVKRECPGFADKTRHGFFVSALGEIIQRVKYERHYRYAVAFPETYREMAVRRIPWAAAKKIGLEILLVDEKGHVDRLTWTHLKTNRYTQP